MLKIFGKWDEIIKLEPEHQGTPYLDGIWSYVLGSAYLAKGNMDKALIELKNLQDIAFSPDADKYRVGATPASQFLKLLLMDSRVKFIWLVENIQRCKVL
ncbi:MAG: hypothetical protein CM15mP86_05070 [Gammaproteobacteria bacterium]|nr:MAG: hypothetical protein CM15mP86_05070 [Gammaproteobacteria bacterium]